MALSLDALEQGCTRMGLSIDPYLLDFEDLGFEIARRNAEVPEARVDREIALEQLILEGSPTSPVGPPFEENLQRARTLLREVNKLLVFGQLNANAASLQRVRAKIHSTFAHILNRVICLKPSSRRREADLRQFAQELEVCERLIKESADEPQTNEEQPTPGSARRNTTAAQNADDSSREEVESWGGETLDRTPRGAESPRNTARSERGAMSPVPRNWSPERPPDERPRRTHEPPYKWNLTFQGGHKGPTLLQFLERVHELRVTRNPSEH